MRQMSSAILLGPLILSLSLITSCGSSGSGFSDTISPLPDTSKTDPSNPSQDPVPPSDPSQQGPTEPEPRPVPTTLAKSTTTTIPKSSTTTVPRTTSTTVPKTTTTTTVKTTTTTTMGSRTHTVDVLLFNGQGISTSDWQSTEQIVKSMGLSYRLVNSAGMNVMSLDEMSSFGLMIFPGGTRGGIMSGLNDQAQLRIRQAIRDRGVSYLGVCAGAFAAVGTLANTDTVSEVNLGITYGSTLKNWWPNGDTTKVAAVVPVSFPDGSLRYLVWWGGPWTPEWKNGVVARYSDGKPAISQTWFNKGFVILTGPHAEAPQGWRYTAGTDPDGLDYELFKKLVKAGLNREPLPTY